LPFGNCKFNCKGDEEDNDNFYWIRKPFIKVLARGKEIKHYKSQIISNNTVGGPTLSKKLGMKNDEICWQLGEGPSHFTSIATQQQ